LEQGIADVVLVADAPKLRGPMRQADYEAVVPGLRLGLQERDVVGDARQRVRDGCRECCRRGMQLSGNWNPCCGRGARISCRVAKTCRPSAERSQSLANCCCRPAENLLEQRVVRIRAHGENADTAVWFGPLKGLASVGLPGAKLAIGANTHRRLGGPGT